MSGDVAEDDCDGSGDGEINNQRANGAGAGYDEVLATLATTRVRVCVLLCSRIYGCVYRLLFVLACLSFIISLSS